MLGDAKELADVPKDVYDEVARAIGKFDDETVKAFMSSSKLNEQMKNDIAEKFELASAESAAATATAASGAAATGAAGGFAAFTASVKGAVAGLATFLTTNPVGWAILAAAAVAAVAGAYDLLTESFDEAAEKANDAKTEFESISSELQSLQSELATTSSRIDELKAKGPLSLAEQAELSNLERQNELLEKQIEVRERMKNVQQQFVAETSARALRKKDFTVKTGEREIDANGTKMAITEQTDIFGKVLQEQKDLDEIEARREALTNELNELLKNGDVHAPNRFGFGGGKDYNQYTAVKNALDSLDAQSHNLSNSILEDFDQINTLYEGLYDESGNISESNSDLVDSFNQVSDAVLNAGDKATKAESQIETVLSLKTMDGVKEKLINAASFGGEDTLRSAIEDTDNLTGALEHSKVSVDELVTYIMNLAGSDLGNLAEQAKQLRDAFGNRKWETLQQFDDFLKGLDGEQLHTFYKYIQDNKLDISKWSMDDLKYNFGIAMDGAEDTQEAIERLTAGYGDMAEAIDEAQGAQSKMNEILKGNEGNQMYLDFSSAFQQLKEYVDAGKTGVNSKFWDILSYYSDGEFDRSKITAENYEKMVDAAEKFVNLRSKWYLDKDEDSLSTGSYRKMLQDMSANTKLQENIKKLREDGKEAQLELVDGEWKVNIDSTDIDKLIDGTEYCRNDVMALMEQYSNYGYMDWADKATRDTDKVNAGIDKIKDNYAAFVKGLSSASGVAAPSQFNSWIDSLSSEDRKIVYDISLKDDAASYTLEQWKQELAKSHSLDVNADVTGKEDVKSLSDEVESIPPYKNITVGAQIEQKFSEVALDPGFDEIKNKFKNITSEMSGGGGTFTVRADVEGKGDVDNLSEAIKGIPQRTVPQVQADVRGIQSVKNLNSAIDNLPASRTITVTTVKRERKIGDTTPRVNGTAHSAGTAYAGGNWGAKKSGTSLVGELGPEIRVRGSEYDILGADGTELADVRKGDIIFNAAQTEEILKKGKLTGADARGHIAHASGTAYAKGAGLKDGDLKTIQSSKSKNESSSKKSNKSSSKNSKSKSNKDKSKSSKSKDKRKKTGSNSLDKFQKWVEKFFDWVEIRLDRLSRKTEGFVTKAERKAANGNYGGARTQYQKALNNTVTQIDANQKGEKKYREQANKVLRDAAAGGLIKLKDVPNIQRKVADGTIDISEYGEKMQTVIKEYQEYYEKSLDCSKNVSDLLDQYQEYAEALYNLPFDKLNSSLEKVERTQKLLEAQYKNALTAAEQNKIIAEQNKQAAKELKSYQTLAKDTQKNLNDAKSKIDSAKDKSLNGLSKTEKSIVTSAVKNGEAVNTDQGAFKGLSSSGKSAITAYNNALKANTTAAKNAKAAADKLKTTKSKIDSVKDSALKGLSNADKKKIVKAVSEGKEIKASSYKKLSKAGKDAIAAYNDALKASKSAATKAKTAADNLKTAKGKIDSAKDSALSGLSDSDKSKITSAVSKGQAISLSAFTNLTNASTAAIVSYNEALKQNIEAANQAQIAAEEYTTTLYENAKTMFDNVKAEYDSTQGVTNAEISDAKALVSNLEALSSTDVTKYINAYNSAIARTNDLLYSQRQELSALESSYSQNGSGMTLEDRNTAMAEIIGVREEIRNTESAIEELKDSLRDKVLWMTFERAHENVKQIANLLSGIENLIDDDMMFNSNGEITEYGIAQLSLLAKQYNQADKEVRNYQRDIDNLNRLYMQGYYTSDEYKDKLNEIQTSMLDAAADMKKYSDEVIDAYKKMSESELNALDDLIEKRQKALEKKKDYYDYDKTIKSKAKDIQEITAQIAALEGVDTAAARAKRAELQADLTEKQDDLNDTVNDHLMELSQDALDDLKDALSDAFDDYWENISLDFGEIQRLLADANALSAESASTLTKLLRQYGINDVSSQIKASAGYASGTRRVPRKMTALTQENGGEIVITKAGMFTPLRAGDGVIPAHLTDRLYDMALGNIPSPLSNMPSVSIPTVSPGDSTTHITQHYDNLINVEGNVDSSVVTDLEAFAKQFYAGAYTYAQKKNAKEMSLAGYKRKF